MPRSASMEVLYEAKESGVATIDGQIVPFKKGELFRADHPLLQHEGRRKALFRLTDMVRPQVEKTTAAPGEKRGEVA